jgi:hypothetical protein
MNKERIIELFNGLSPDDKMEVVKAILPEFCKSLSQEPHRMQEMMNSMMNFWGKDRGGWMAMMRK